MVDGFDDPKTAAEYALYSLAADTGSLIAQWAMLRDDPDSVASLALIRDRINVLLGDVR